MNKIDFSEEFRRLHTPLFDGPWLESLNTCAMRVAEIVDQVKTKMTVTEIEAPIDLWRIFHFHSLTHTSSTQNFVGD